MTSVMNRSGHKARSAYILVALVSATSGCASLPKLDRLTSEESPAETGHPQSATLDEAIRLLGEGQPERAETLLTAILAKNPKQPRALNLMRQIGDDPQKLLGEDFQSYTVQPGDTLSELAEEYAGDSFLFYALSRYNGLASPKSLSVGAVIQVPVRAAAIANTSSITPLQTSLDPEEFNLSPGQPDLRGVTSTTLASDIAQAGDLRRNALKMLNAGNIETAVTDLRQAKALAPGDPAIEADLSRAERLFEAVQKRER